MSTPMCPVVHFEMPYRDAARATRFYTEVFGWQIQAFGEEMGHYLMATTASEDSAEPGTKRGVINGGMFPFQADWPMQHPSVVIAVADIRAAMARVNAGGGEVMGEPMPIPGVGDYVSFMDTEGNRHSMLQPLMPG